MMKVSFVLFDEIEKASDALWNLLLRVLDKDTLTLGDNRKVNFSRSMIFMTSNLGATEMSPLASPTLGFGVYDAGRKFRAGVLNEGLRGKLEHSGLQAARRNLHRKSSTVWTRLLQARDYSRALSS